MGQRSDIVFGGQKRLKAAAIVFSMLFVFLFARFCLAALVDLEFSMSLDKAEYTASDPINALFKLKNNGKAPVYINKRFYLSSEDSDKKDRDLFLQVTSPSGKKLPCKFSYKTGLPKTDYFELLAVAGEAQSEYKKDLRGYFDFSQPGVYKIVAVYENVYGKEIGLDAFEGKLISSPVSLKIIDSENGKNAQFNK
jgi:hypothetical protein